MRKSSFSVSELRNLFFSPLKKLAFFYPCAPGSKTRFSSRAFHRFRFDPLRSGFSTFRASGGARRPTPWKPHNQLGPSSAALPRSVLLFRTRLKSYLAKPPRDSLRLQLGEQIKFAPQSHSSPELRFWSLFSFVNHFIIARSLWMPA